MDEGTWLFFFFWEGERGRGGEVVLVYCPVGLADFLGPGGGHEADDPSGGLGVVILDCAEELQVEVLHEGKGNQVLA